MVYGFFFLHMTCQDIHLLYVIRQDGTSGPQWKGKQGPSIVLMN